MKYVPLMVLLLLLAGCDDNRVYDEYHDFDDRYWLVQDKPEFTFEVKDATVPYDLYCGVRNAVSYPFARFFVHYQLEDSAGRPLQQQLMQQFLFDAKTGEPHGRSGLGDLYDHDIALLKNYKFAQPGKYKIRFEQMMRRDTLQGMLAIGLRVETKVVDPTK